ncbi:MAG: hypothetical protein ACT4QG_18400 [Sporichthyaceae bacterium]
MRKHTYSKRRDLRSSLVIGSAVAVVTAIATTGVIGTGGVGTAAAAIDPSAPYGRMVISLPSGATATVTEAPSTAASPSPLPSLNPSAPPELRIALTYQRRNRDLLLKLAFEGAVYLPYTQDGKLVEMKDPADRSIGLDEVLQWGDGTSYRTASGNRCAKADEASVLRAVKDGYELRKKYSEAGEYTLDYLFKACGLTGGQIAGTLKIRIP